MHWSLHPRAAPGRVRQIDIKSHHVTRRNTSQNYHGKQKSDHHLYRLIVIGQQSSKVRKRSITVVPIMMLAVRGVKMEILFSSACTHVSHTLRNFCKTIHLHRLPSLVVGLVQSRSQSFMTFVFVKPGQLGRWKIQRAKDTKHYPLWSWNFLAQVDKL